MTFSIGFNGRSIARQAEFLPIVQSGYLSQAQASYCLAWCQKTNPKGANCPTLVNGIGPDFGTTLLSANPSFIFGTETEEISLPAFEKRWDSWQDLADLSIDDIDISYVASQRTRWLKNEGVSNDPLLEIKGKRPWHEVMDDPNLFDRLKRELTGSLEIIKRTRYQAGYYPTEGYHFFDIETYMVNELIALDVDQSKVQFQSIEDDKLFIIDFPWQHPNDKEPKQRRIAIIHSTDAKDFLEKLPNLNLPFFQVYYEKSLDKPLRINNYKKLSEQMGLGSFILIGKPRTEDLQSEQRHLPKMFWFTEAFAQISMDPLDVPDRYTDAMIEHIRPIENTLRNNPEFGWRMTGMLMPKKFAAERLWSHRSLFWPT